VKIGHGDGVPRSEKNVPIVLGKNLGIKMIGRDSAKRNPLSLVAQWTLVRKGEQ